MSEKHTPYIDPRGYVLKRVCLKAYERWPTCRQTCARYSSRKQRLPGPAELLSGRRGRRASGERGPRRGDEGQRAKLSHRGLWRNFAGGYCKAEHVSLIAKTPDLMRFLLPTSGKNLAGVRLVLSAVQRRVTACRQRPVALHQVVQDLAHPPPHYAWAFAFLAARRSVSARPDRRR